MKQLNLIAAAAVLAFASSAASALTASDGFDVTVNFTAACKVKTAAADMTFTYTAFGAAQQRTATTVFECSRGLTPTFSFDNTSATQSGQTTPVALGAAITGEGIISGVRYTLAGSSSKTQTGTAAAAGTDGTADEYTVGLTADVASQAGGTGTGGTHNRTLVITY